MYTLGKRVLLLPFALSLLWLGAAASAAQAEDFCALTVNIETVSNHVPSRTWVELRGESGTIERREQVPGATFKICDFGFGPHTLTVGTNECLPVSVSNLRVVIGSPVHLTVFMNTCGYQDVMRNGCLLYLRTVDQRGGPVADVNVIYPPNIEVQARTDSFGRYQALVSRGTSAIVLVKDGFADNKIVPQCRGSEEIDLSVRMDRSKPVGEND